MIEELTLRDFKGHRDSVVRLAPLTLLVGPNGAGKTSALQALRALGQLQSQSFDVVFPERARDALIRHSEGVTGFQIGAVGASAGGRRGVLVWTFFEDLTDFDADGEERSGGDWHTQFRLTRGDEEPRQFMYTGRTLPEEGHGGHWPELRASVLLRLDARRVAAPSPASSRTGVEQDGGGTATALANLKLLDEERLERVISDLRRIVPQVERVRAVPGLAKSQSGREEAGYSLIFDFQGARGIPASGVSEGTLLALALVILLNQRHLILLDDVNHALHPTAQQRLVAVLRALTAGPAPVQVVATSHSPYILDAVPPEAVQVFALRPDGTVAIKPLSAHPEAEAHRGILSSGQLWTLDDEQRWVLEDAP